MSSGVGDEMLLSKLTQTEKKLSRKLRYITSEAYPLPKQEYEIEGMQAEGDSLYYCIAPAEEADDSKFPQYIVSVDR